MAQYELTAGEVSMVAKGLRVQCLRYRKFASESSVTGRHDEAIDWHTEADEYQALAERILLARRGESDGA